MNKKIGIMQPYFFPYIGYWQLLNYVDTFVIYDNIKFTKGSWIRKNKFLLFGQEKTFSISLKKDSDNLNVNERFISDEFLVERKKILKQIESSYKKAPYFSEVYPVLQRCFLYEEKNLFNFIYFSIKNIVDYLSIDTKLIVSSNLEINSNVKGKDRVIEICKQLDATDYINPPGGVNLYNKDEFNLFDIKLSFLVPKAITYRQLENTFIPNLSIIDVIMFNSVEEVKEILMKYEIH